jgi:multicomponent Na+:H+ antiporter subunit E
MKKKVFVFILAFSTWCLLNWLPDWQHILVGAVAALFVSFMTADLFVKRPELLEQPRRYWHFIYFVPLFVWHWVVASISVAYRILHPDLPFHSGIVKVKTKLKSETALTLLANAITLGAGTLTVDIDRENGFFYVHWVDVKTEDVEAATKSIVERFEKILVRVFE